MVNTGNNQLFKHPTSVFKARYKFALKWINTVHRGCFLSWNIYYIKATMSDFLLSENKETTDNGTEVKMPQIKVVMLLL